MAKNIIICSDGTGNSAIKGRGTNVFKLFEAIDLNGHRTNPELDAQVGLYDDGVGTQGFVPLKVLGGAFGFGLARNVRKLYKELVRIYDPGDRIFLFGFSRGAFTVRTLAGMIAKCGVLDRQKLPTSDALQGGVCAAYRVYRRSYRTWIQSMLHTILRRSGLRRSDPDVMAEFRRGHSLDGEVRISVIGVWDTVDAVGGPFHSSDIINALLHRFKFPDHKLSDKVDFAYHALAIDEARAAFEPRLWEADPRIQQVWFAGVHSNVGGGYPKHGMSLVALDWMLRAARDHGLRVLDSDARFYREHANVDDKLYDSRSGVGVFYRWKPRDIKALCELHGAGPCAVIHLSALERIAHGTDGYNPGTLPGELSVTFTRSDDRDPSISAREDAAAGTRAASVELAMRTAFAARAAGLHAVRRTLWIGRLAYYLYVVSCIVALATFAVMASNAHNVLRVLSDPWTIGLLVSAFAVSGGLAMHVDGLRSKTFSRFWHLSRQELREALKESRKRMLDPQARRAVG